MPATAKTLALIVCLYAGYALVCFFMQRQLLFPRHCIPAFPNLDNQPIFSRLRKISIKID